MPLHPTRRALPKTLLVLAAMSSAVSGTEDGALNGWAATSAPIAKAATHTLHFQLQPSDANALNAAFAQRVEPDSPLFRSWLTTAEIAALVAPPAHVVDRLRQWVAAKSPALLTALGPTPDYLFVTGSTADLEQLLHGATGGPVLFCEFAHPRARGTALRRCSSGAGQPTRASDVLPSELAAAVVAVHGVDELLPVPSTPAARSGGQFPGADIFPSVIKAQYQLRATTGGKSQMTQGVAAFEDAQFLPSDVLKFQQDQNLTVTKMSVLGPNSGGYFGEASLDTQYIFATGDGVPGWFIAQESFDMLSWAFKVMNMSSATRPTVLSISWGGGESGYPVPTMQAANAEFQKMALLGISVFAASGDAGTGKQGMFRCKAFDATYPASSPFVTAVGGTFLDKDTKVEHGWSDSGGGFSAVFGRPSYQQAAVAVYLGSGAVPAAAAGLFNASGRAVPDVSALSTNFQICSSGAYGPLSGTSAATPTFAGMVSVINDALLSEGKPPVGFINPVLYKSTLHIGFDVTDGNNKQPGCPAGFPAVKGWDALSGFGTPIFDALETILRAG